VRFNKQQTFISYPGLAAGMLEIADEESEKCNGKSVSVVNPGGGAKIEYSSVPLLFEGLLVHVFPLLHSWLY